MRGHCCGSVIMGRLDLDQRERQIPALRQKKPEVASFGLGEIMWCDMVWCGVAWCGVEDDRRKQQNMKAASECNSFVLSRSMGWGGVTSGGLGWGEVGYVGVGCGWVGWTGKVDQRENRGGGSDGAN